MTITRFSKLLLVVLALALCAGTASAQIASDTPTMSFTYTKGTVTAAQTANITDGGNNSAYTNSTAYNPASGSNQWVSISNTGSFPDTLSVSVATAAANLMAPGTTYSATITLTGSTDNSTALITVNLTVVSPLSAGAASSNAALTFVKTGGASQAAASTTVTVTNSDSSADAYTTVVGGTCPNWLDVVSAHNKQPTSAQSDTLTLSIDSTTGAAAAVGSITTCTVQLQYIGVTFKTVTFTSLNIVAQPLKSSATSVGLTYIKGGGGINSGSTNLSVAASTPNTAFTLDAATVPLWLTVSPTSGTATNSGNVAITFTVNTAIAASMATGNYTANVGFFATGFADLIVPVTFSISNVSPTVGIKEGTTEIDNVWSYGSALPTPTVTPYSSNEPMPFTASCAVVVTSNTTYTPTATSCLLNGSQATSLAPLAGVAYTWGYGMTVTFDSAIFALPIGTTAKVTVTVTPQGGSAISLAYKYTFQPIDPVLTSLFPTSVAQIAHNTSVAILLKGSNFIGAQNIANGTVVPTQVWLGSSTTALTASNVVVLSPTQMMVTIPQSAFPTYASGKTSATLAIGVANQTGSSAPTTPKVSINLNVTNAPVVYGITSTATYNQPAIGSNPTVAQYDLISIFGDNFGYLGLSPNFSTATLNSFGQVPTSLTVTGSGAHAVNLSVAFKDGKNTYNAPILFANQNQINAIVPSGVTPGDTVYVTVTSGATTNASDGLFAAGIVTADPGIFTLSSDGTGQGAILNHDNSVNMVGNAEHIGNFVQIYMSGLGAPDSTNPDVASQTAGSYPTSCVVVSNTAAATPGYLQVVNTKTNSYTAPSPAWTSIDGATILASMLKTNVYPPCMTDNITVTFGTGANAKTATTTGGGVLWAGFSAGSVAGLYQVNVTIPANTTTGNSVPVTVTIGSYTSQTVTMAIQ